jgi:benzodiazapine receptor
MHTTRTTPPQQALGLLFWLTVSFVAAAIGAVASVDAGAFYAELIRPTWAPPAWLFGPMWSTLYALMGIAAWQVWREGRMNGADTRGALRLYVVQLVVNAMWSWLFFKWHLGAWAFAEVLVLWALILTTLIAFWRVRTMAGVLLLPYLAWVTLATALTWSVWRANPHLLG